MTLDHKSTRDPRRRSGRQKRTGMVIIAALTCLLIVTAIVGSMLQSAIQARRQLHTERDLRQTELLLQAGIDRAASRIAQDPEFTGDTWELPADAIVGRGVGRVTTKIEHSDARQNWQIHVVAEYPLDRNFPIQRSQTFEISSAAIQFQE